MWIKGENYIAYRMCLKYFWNDTTAKHIGWFFNCLIILLFFGCFNYIFKSIYAGGKFEDIALNLAWISAILFGAYVATILRLAAKEALGTWDYAEMNPHFQYPADKLLKGIKYHTMLIKASTVYAGLASITGFIFYELQNCENYKDLNVCGVPFPIDIFVVAGKRPFREIINVVMFSVLLYVFIAIPLAFSFLHLFIVFTDTFLGEFKNILAQLSQTDDKHLRRHKLIKAYELHQFALKIWTRVAGIFKWPLLMQYLFSSYILALIIISELIKVELLSLAHAVVWVCAILSLGYFGEEMKRLSEEFKNATFYSVPWDGDIETAKFLMFMNLSLRNGFDLALGNYAVYSNELVLLTYQMVYSVVTLFINRSY